MRYEWNSRKNQINYEKHGLNFKDAETIFSSRTVSFIDDREDYSEERFITLGELHKRVVVVVHTQRGEFTRIISMRRANEREKKIYFKRLEEAGQND
jgi:uncharacterized DUF497 family protein